MSLSYNIDSENCCVFISGTGALPMSAMIAVVDAVADDPQFLPEYCVILDLRHADYAAEISDGEAFVSTLKRRQNDFQGRFAIVVPEHLQLLARLYSLLADSSGFDRMKCFLKLEDALSWCEKSDNE